MKPTPSRCRRRRMDRHGPTTAASPRSALARQRPVTQGDVEGLLDNALSGIQSESAKQLYIAQKMGDVPQSYHQFLPASTDPEALKAGEQIARANYRNDYSKLAAVATDRGHLPADLYSPDAIKVAVDTGGQPDLSNLNFRQHAAAVLGADAPELNPEDAAKVAAEEQGLDLSAMSPQQRLAFRLRQEKPGMEPVASSSSNRPAGGSLGDALRRQVSMNRPA